MSDEQISTLPTTIGRYQVIRRLGQGGMATVYAAHDPNVGREVAVKVLPQAMLHDPTFRTRFEREAHTVAQLDHPAIVPVYDFGETEDGQPFLVMKLMSGGALSDHLERGPLLLSDCAAIFEQIAPALDAAHALGVVHRDLKPGNILFDAESRAYIADFGIAKLSEQSLALTGSATIGTPAYMSPEQARGEISVDGRSDIYSLGAILFEMLTGELPYNADTPMGICVRHITDPVPRILTVRPDLPPGCEDLIGRAMAKDPARRFQTTADFAEAVRAVASGEALAPTKVAARVDAASVPRDELPTIPPPGAAPTDASLDAATRDLKRISDTFQKAPRRKRNMMVLFGGIGLLVLIVLVRAFNDQLAKILYPGYILLPGAIVTYLGARDERPRAKVRLVLLGTFIVMVGALLQYMAIFNHYEAWAYMWPLLLPGSIGLGLLLATRWGSEHTRGKLARTLVYIALGLFGIGWLSFDVLMDISQNPFAAVLWAPAVVGLAAVGVYRYLAGESRV